MNEKRSNKLLKFLITIIAIVLLSAVIMTVTFVFSSADLNIELFKSYFQSINLIFMNILPIVIFISLIYVMSNRLWLSFSLGSALFGIASLVNKFKLTYRDDPFTFEDIKLISESMAMTKSYEIKFTINIILIIAGLIILTFLVKKFFKYEKYKINSKKIRISLAIVIVFVSVFSFKGLYYDNETYAELGDDELINVWSQPQQFQSKGFVYPFLHSIADSKDVELEGYDEEQAKADLNQYDYKDIPEDEKINVVGIMLEAYNDFSKFDTMEIDESVYEDFHEVQENSLHGNLVTNVFAGGTIDTERGFITGYQDHPKYLTNTNSFAWYFKEQGYKTKAMHPLYGWFYNRRNINEYLGLGDFDYYENKYEAEQEEILDDMEFFDYFIEDYEETIAKGEPYFNFSVTYQNHGPYPYEKQTEKELLKRKPEYEESKYNVANNYLHGVAETGAAIKKLTDYFEERDEPVIVVMFGDHNPWLGEENSVYKMLDIDLDFSEEEGFLNYYQTPYIVWGNTEVKEKLGKDFNEEGPDLSPNFLMPTIFEYLGWEGNEYMQYLIDLKKDIDVNHKVFFKENGIYTKELSKENEEKYQDFRNLEYYYSRNFIEHKIDKDK